MLGRAVFFGGLVFIACSLCGFTKTGQAQFRTNTAVQATYLPGSVRSNSFKRRRVFTERNTDLAVPVSEYPNEPWCVRESILAQLIDYAERNGYRGTLGPRAIQLPETIEELSRAIAIWNADSLYEAVKSSPKKTFYREQTLADKIAVPQTVTDPATGLTVTRTVSLTDSLTRVTAETVFEDDFATAMQMAYYIHTRPWTLSLENGKAKTLQAAFLMTNDRNDVLLIDDRYMVHEVKRSSLSKEDKKVLAAIARAKYLFSNRKKMTVDVNQLATWSQPDGFVKIPLK